MYYSGLTPGCLLFSEMAKKTIAYGNVVTDTKHLVDLEIKVMSVIIFTLNPFIAPDLMRNLFHAAARRLITGQ